MGDFNALSSLTDRIGGAVRYSEIVDMLDCIDKCHLEDVKAFGRYFTWNNK